MAGAATDCWAAAGSSDAKRATERTAANFLRSCIFISVFARKGVCDCLVGHRRHDFVPCGIRMQAVVGQFALQHALAVDQRRKIIEIYEAVRGAIVFEPGVERKYSFART